MADDSSKDVFPSFGERLKSWLSPRAQEISGVNEAAVAHSAASEPAMARDIDPDRLIDELLAQPLSVGWGGSKTAEDSEIGRRLAQFPPAAVCRMLLRLEARAGEQAAGLAGTEMDTVAINLGTRLADLVKMLIEPTPQFCEADLREMFLWFPRVEKRLGYAKLPFLSGLIRTAETLAAAKPLLAETQHAMRASMTFLENHPNAENAALLNRCLKLAPRTSQPTPEQMDALLCSEMQAFVDGTRDVDTFRGSFQRVEKLASMKPLSPELTQAILDALGSPIDWSFYRELDRLWAILPTRLPVLPSDVWTCRALRDVETMAESQRAAWVALFTLCRGATASKPSGKWLKNAAQRVREIGMEAFRDCLYAWLSLSGKARQDIRPTLRHTQELELDDVNTDVLRGLIWCAGFLDGTELPGVMVDLAIASYRKIPGRGPRASRIGNAALWVLGELPGLRGAGALSVLKTRVKSAGAQKLIDAALTQIAAREGLPRDEVEELAVPGYGMESVGLRTEPLGEFSAELRILDDGSTELLWRKADGKLQKAAPASVKEHFADDLKELKQAAQDIQRQLPAQKKRLDRLFVLEKRWPYPLWRERYLDHPLLGVLARRLIWRFERDGAWRDGIYDGDALRDRSGQALDGLDERTQVSLWHPLNCLPADVLAWREWLEQKQVTQPMKQAHREIYLLTDAERATAIYSNRFAAHILKQHQFNALCGARDWRNRLHICMDEDFPGFASRELPQWDLRASFSIEGLGGTNDTGAFTYVTTDQVRFYPLHPPHHSEFEAALPLDQVPPLVLSEVMRDLDLFVGVASVGNDPAWVDGGEDGHLRAYWQEYAFGALSESAKTRYDVLSRLLPRLKIAARCTLDARFLQVRGDLRTYRIHLGSGNILMSPNDQYLCIVPVHDGKNARVFLPFEGDATLSLILSKAFLLAEDKKIADPTILAQIRRGPAMG